MRFVGSGSRRKKVKTRSQIAVLLLLAAVAVGPAFGQQSRVYRERNSWVEETTGTIPAAKSLKVIAAMGSIKVQGGARSDVAYVVKKRSYAASEEAARREFERFRVAGSRSGDTAMITGESEQRSFHRFSAEFSVETPRNMEFVRLDTRGGGVSVRGVAGRVELSTGGGSVNLADLGGPVVARSGGGSIEVNGVSGDLLAKTGGGSIQVVSAKGRVEANTGGGNIDVRECTGETQASTGGGSIVAGQIGGPATMTTGGGNIRMSGANGPVEVSTGGGSIELLDVTQGARVSTGAGSITAEFVGAGSGSSLNTSAGDIIVYLSPAIKVSVNAAIEMASGHRIRSDFPELKITTEGPEYGPRMVYAEGSLNGGGPTLRIRTATGDIELRRAKTGH